MKIQFSSTQDYQLKAVESVVSIFEGQPLAKSTFEVDLVSDESSVLFKDECIANNLVLSEDQILSNLQKIQAENEIISSDVLEPVISEDKRVIFNRLNFTVEMETGTGKTYTYIRTIYELYERYGFRKFVIVVPSIAIREGTYKNLQITNEHFQELYRKPNVNFEIYNSKSFNNLRSFATSDAIQILIINIDSFTKDSNIINSVRETGKVPIDYIKSTNPIVIVDEPQNFETDVRKLAINNLNPLCTLRYSATHKNLYNLIYSLNPVKAYDLGLVKQIEVDGITTEDSYVDTYLSLISIIPGKKYPKAKLSAYVNKGNGVSKEILNIGVEDDLYDITKRDSYKNNFILSEIDVKEGYIRFANDVTLKLGQTIGGLTDEILKFQIERTVKHHLNKLLKLKPLGVKVLSLFFLDKVSNYRVYDEQGNPEKGKYAIWMEQALQKYLNESTYKGLLEGLELDELHNGYFSVDKLKGKKKDIWIDSSEEKSNEKDEYIYNLIMKDKEELLNVNNPLQFIFSHTALREGWDNPNVFQLCTLADSRSELKKRQEIGRGLRLPVDQCGIRILDKDINILTVIANESYQEFTNSLQKQIEDETSVSFAGRVKNFRDKENLKLNNELTKENYPELFEIWNKINHKTKYSVSFDTEKLIKNTVTALEDFKRFPKAKKPILFSNTASIAMDQDGIKGELTNTIVKKIDNGVYPVPDVYEYIQSRINLTRNTINEIIRNSNRFEELLINPQQFLDHVIDATKGELNKLLVDGIKYEKIEEKYSMTLFNKDEHETYLSNLHPVKKKAKTVYNFVPVDSDPERKFATDCDVNDDVKFYFKLPKDFLIPTPIGSYRPDWGIIFENEKRVYFVAETKGSLNKEDIRGTENMKIEFGDKHFNSLQEDGLEYKLAVTSHDLY